MTTTRSDSRPQRTARVDELVPPLSTRHVLVVGCGSVGSYLADILARHGVGHFTLIDPDTIEAANLSRSVYRCSDIGTQKVVALADHLQAIDRTTQVQTHGGPMAGLTDSRLAGLISAADLVVAATDDPVTQAALNHRAYALGSPSVFCALYRGAAAGEVVITVPQATPCWMCATGGAASPANTREKDYGTGRLAAETALGADILTVVSVAAKHALGLLAGPHSPAGAQTVTALARHSMCIIATAANWDWFPSTFTDVDGQYAPQSVWLTVAGGPSCPVCGPNPEPPLPPLDLSTVTL